jgi:hypothetical protein
MIQAYFDWIFKEKLYDYVNIPIPPASEVGYEFSLKPVILVVTGLVFARIVVYGMQLVIFYTRRFLN